MKNIFLSVLVVIFPLMANAANSKYGDWMVVSSSQTVTASSQSTNQPKRSLIFTCGVNGKSCSISITEPSECKTDGVNEVALLADDNYFPLLMKCNNNQLSASYSQLDMAMVFDALKDAASVLNIRFSDGASNDFSLKGLGKAVNVLEGHQNNFSS
ncbi:hypothetical protein D5018_16825 [Parashewanella curva]|uniref:Uncharacterized protein n=1 Tax=Parashewanella curva TaxID=2338552 RepID=A0A3L8PT49_9GAMM|nr:hypothetical protein [Parashewanella curva]RLV58516.1 hypothetical protein D5018_16825 [Parashewanella curva]